MITHISEELPRLLTGDAPRDVVLTAADHLRGCPDCQQELVSAVVAHASLTSAQRFAPEVVAPGPPVDAEPGPALPDLTSVFSKVRAEAAGPGVRTRRRRIVLAVAAAAVIAGAGTTVAVVQSGSSGSSTRHVSLAPFAQGRSKVVRPATVTLVGDNRMRVDATSLPKVDAQHRYEVWLTDQGRTQMQSVGFIGADRTADLQVASTVMSQYNDIEVSLQRVDQETYSGISYLRGSYG